MSDNKDSQKAAQKRWYEKNKERILRMRAEYYRANREALQKYGRDYDKKRRCMKKVDTTKQSDDSSLKAAAEVKNRLLQELDDY